jgi:hypothetical protein
MFNKHFGLLAIITVTLAPTTAFAQLPYDPVGAFNQQSQSIISDYQRTINNIEAQSAASPGYLPAGEYNVYTTPPGNYNGSMYTAPYSWVNWFNNYGHKWTPRIMNRSHQEIYGY